MSLTRDDFDDQYDQVELENLATNERKKEESIKNNQRISLAVGTVESLDIAAIFTMFLQGFLHKFLEELGKYFMFPIAAGASVIQAILAWRQAYLDGGQSRSIVNALVETVAAVAITTAVIGTLVATATFAVAGPAIFTGVMALKTLYHFGSAAYYGGKYAVYAARYKATGNEEDEKEKETAKTMAINSGIATFAGLVATAAVTGVFLLGKVAMAAVGIVAGILGAAISLYHGITSFKKEQAKAALTVSIDDNDAKKIPHPKPNPRLTIIKGLGINKEDLEKTVNSTSNKHSVPSIPSAPPATNIQGTPLLLQNEEPHVPRTGLSLSAKF